ncbi:vWA domain-containing protein [Nitrosomonas nitrosa]|uniref:vWA domain-containing protein n=1 Tax=Nitrosomonas nitrosa TaxID=52442 RepID=UPI0023F83598|nr:vWA domain-containing protein [Nitrosomonas nitrosa]MCO6435110.1 VWA domain-containing protein [Nitrosomonas nitrosa]
MVIDLHSRVILVSLVLLLTYSNAVVALTLTVPYRGATSMQTASTMIEFDASNITGGATISIDGQSVAVPATPCAGNACSSLGSTPAGDDILVRRISGTNRARLELTYFGSFSAPYCASTITPAGRSFEVVLSGFTFANTGNGYRITSFMAPSDASCDIPYARVPSNRPFLTSNPAEQVLTRLGRLPLNIVLALDKSNSMSWTIPGSADIRWNRLKDSAILFASVWDVVGAPPAPATVSSEGHAEDRLGLIFFDTTSSESMLGGITFFQERGNAVSPWSGSITNAMNLTSPSGWTSIGSAVANAKLRLDEVEALIGDTAIVLFTDGEQNRSPCIVHVGEMLSPSGSNECAVAASAGTGALLTLNGSNLAQSTPRGAIFTIGLGEGGMAGAAQLLDEISQETAGRAWFPNNGIAMDTTFIDSLVENLKGGTVSLLSRSTGNIAATADAVSDPLVATFDDSLTRVVFVLGWEGVGNVQDLSLVIHRPDGTVVTAPLSQANTNSRVVGVNLPEGGPSGDWEVQVIRTPMTVVTHVPRFLPVNYHLSVYGVESRLSARITESPRLGTGKPVKIVAEIGWDGVGLENLPSSSIRAHIERPSENLGNILSQEKQVKRDLPNDTSPLAAKISQLIESENLLEKIEPRILPDSLPLEHVGSGRYEATFDGANLGGVYRFRVDFDWNDERTGQIKRTQIAERQVRVLPTEQDSQIKTRLDADSGSVWINIIPMDQFGNLVGPGFEHFFSVKVDGMGLVPVSDPNLTGKYEIRVPGEIASADPRVEIVFDNQDIRNELLSKIEKSDINGDELTWWQWLLLILVTLLLLFILLLLWRKSKQT